MATNNKDAGVAEEEEGHMRKHKGQAAFAAAMAILLAVSLAGCCRSKDDDRHSLSLLGGLLGGAANPAQVNLAAADSFRVLAGSTVTNTGLTSVDGDLGVSPGSAVTGFPPGTVSGSIFTGSPGPAATAQSDLTIAYNDAAGRPSGTIVSGNIGGQTLAPGVFTSTSSLAISMGDLTLTGLGDSNSVFIFQIPSSLTVTTGRRVNLIGGAQASNVFWQVGSSATLGTNCFFVGTIMAQASITLQTGASLQGRALARTGGVSLDTSVVFP